MVAFEVSDVSSITCIAIIDGVIMILRNVTNNNNNNNNNDNNNNNITKRYYKNDWIIVPREINADFSNLPTNSYVVHDFTKYVFLSRANYGS